MNSTHEEQQYLDLIKTILEKGTMEKGRNGNTLTTFGASMRFDLKNGKIPIFTTKKMAWRPCFEELFWFIRGSTNNEELIHKNVHIWSSNASREFLNSRGLNDYHENDLGPIYGFQWRHFNAQYSGRFPNYENRGIDQLQRIIDDLKNPETRSSRRHILTAWNPCQIDQMALPPCHVMAQFHVREGKYLSCALFQRSGDIGLGIPFNVASYSLFTHILAVHCGLVAHEFVHFIGNAHIYEEHIEVLKEQIPLEPFEFPTIEVSKRDNINDYCLDDIKWTSEYKHHKSLKMKMIA